MHEIWRTYYAHPTAWAQDYAPLALSTAFDDAVARRGDRALVDFYGARISYRRFGALAEGFAAALQGMGVKPGDRVGLFLPNVPDYLVAYYGVLKAGAIVVNMSPLYSVEELAHQVADSGTHVVVTCDVPQLYRTAATLLDRGAISRLVVGSLSGWLPPVKRLLFRLLRRKDRAKLANNDPRIMTLHGAIRAAPGFVPVAIDPAAVAIIQYTGGTTGTPKGATITHAALTANARQIIAIDPHAGDDDRIIGVLPLFHIFANAAVLNRTMMAGGTIVLLPRFDAAQTLAAITRTKATGLPGVPTMFQALLDHPAIGRTNFASLRACISGGAPLPAEVKARFEATTGAIMCEGYGLTESGIATVNPYEGVNKNGTIGQPLPATRIRLVDRDDPSRPPREGEPGEIVIAGPQVMTGYWNRPDATADAFIDGYLRTGDVGTIDADGYIRIVDRLKDMISVGGFKVFPSQVEAVLYRHPAVKEALVIGIPDRYHGEMPKAFVTLFDGADATGEAICDWLNPQLGKHERVIAVEIRASLPKTMIGKLSRKELVAEEQAKAALQK